MSATAIAWYKLKTNSILIAQVPAARIKAGALPLSIAFPAISVTSVSNVPSMNVAMSNTTLMTERVQITVYAKSIDGVSSGYDTQKSILALIRTALANAHGTVNGLTCESIVPAGEGPDIFDDVTLVYEQSADYLVRWHR